MEARLANDPNYYRRESLGEYQPKARPSFDKVWVDVARAVAKRGTCPRRQVGAVIVDSGNQVISTGYNGSPRSLPHCTEVGCLLDDTGRCKRTAHAEANALLQAGSTRTRHSTLYVTDFPCSECAVLIIQARIQRVVFVRPYESQPAIMEEVWDMFDKAGIEIMRWGKK